MSAASPAKAGAFAWSDIDTVILDMDGTLLDLRFDNYFWLELVPHRYAADRGITLDQAQALLTPRFAAHRGTLNWYCTDFWSRELDLDIAALKHGAREHIGWLPGAEDLLRALRAWGKHVLLATNAHPDALRIKHERTGLGQYFDALVSSHRYGCPKEQSMFWTTLQREHPFAVHRTLFVDDSLPVLRAARLHGIAHVVAVTHPDSAEAVRVCDEFPAVLRVGDLLRDVPESRPGQD